MWDLNAEACRRYDEDAQSEDDQKKRSDVVAGSNNHNNPTKWDWELLVRTLSHVRVFETIYDESGAEKKHASLVDAEIVPLGLRNRRRIWGTVEEIFRFGAAKEEEEKWVLKEEDEVVVEGRERG